MMDNGIVNSQVVVGRSNNGLDDDYLNGFAIIERYWNNFRDQNRMSLRAIASKINVSPASLSLAFTKKRKISLVMAIRLCRYLKIGSTDLELVIDYLVKSEERV